MIFRKATQPNLEALSPLQRIHNRIECQNILRLNVLDASNDEGVLVVLCTESSMLNLVKISLKNHWPGEIEVFCPTSLMTGSSISEQTAELPYQVMKKSLRYLN